MSQVLPSAAATLGPTQPEERIPLLDVLRGFALLGILTVNMPGFNSSGFAWAAGLEPFPGRIDKAAEWFVDTVFAGKFNSIFSFMFGLGLTLQMTRAAERGGDVTVPYLRRIAVLFVMGVAHMLLVWNGDVLHMYAILGLLLLAIRRTTNKTVFAIVLLALLLPFARSAYGAATQEAWIVPREEMPARYREEVRVYREGTYAEQVALRTDQTLEIYGFIRQLRGPVMFYFTLIVTMLLGFYVGRRRIIQDLDAHARWIRRLMWWCLGLGLGCAAGAATIFQFMQPTGRASFLGLLAGALFSIQRPLLCLFYIAGIALLFRRERWRRLFMPLASVGRMPLTNYLAQSLIATTLFYSWGFGLYGSVGPALNLVIVAIIFSVQVLYSNWWVARFRFGPMEWLWRGLSYGTFPQMRGQAPQVSRAVV